MKVVAFVPIKLNNERLPGKNTKLLDGKPLCQYMLDTLLAVKSIDEIYVYCSDEAIIEFIPSDVKFLKRSKSLDDFKISHYEIVESFISEIKADIYVNAHVTNPFVPANKIDYGLTKVIAGENDSAHTVLPLREHLWFRGKPFNFERTNLPRTQDIEPLFIDSNLCIYRREVYESFKSRYGDNPYFIELNVIEAVDIDYPEDFKLAETILASRCPPPPPKAYRLNRNYAVCAALFDRKAAA